MKRTLIIGLLASALVATATPPVFAGEVVQSQAVAAANIGKTRAEVKAELATARRNGDLEPVNDNTYPQLLPYQQRHAQIVASGTGQSRIVRTQ